MLNGLLVLAAGVENAVLIPFHDVPPDMMPPRSLRFRQWIISLLNEYNIPHANRPWHMALSLKLVGLHGYCLIPIPVCETFASFKKLVALKVFHELRIVNENRIPSELVQSKDIDEKARYATGLIENVYFYIEPYDQYTHSIVTPYCFLCKTSVSHHLPVVNAPDQPDFHSGILPVDSVIEVNEELESTSMKSVSVEKYCQKDVILLPASSTINAPREMEGKKHDSLNITSENLFPILVPIPNKAVSNLGEWVTQSGGNSHLFYRECQNPVRSESDLMLKIEEMGKLINANKLQMENENSQLKLKMENENSQLKLKMENENSQLKLKIENENSQFQKSMDILNELQKNVDTMKSENSKISMNSNIEISELRKEIRKLTKNVENVNNANLVLGRIISQHHLLQHVAILTSLRQLIEMAMQKIQLGAAIPSDDWVKLLQYGDNSPYRALSGNIHATGPIPVNVNLKRVHSAVVQMTTRWRSSWIALFQFVYDDDPFPFNVEDLSELPQSMLDLLKANTSFDEYFYLQNCVGHAKAG